MCVVENNASSSFCKFLPCILQQREDDLTIEEKYSEDEDNNDADDNTDEEKAEGDEDAVDDNQEDAEYLLGDEGPRATEVFSSLNFSPEI